MISKYLLWDKKEIKTRKNYILMIKMLAQNKHHIEESIHKNEKN